MAVATRPAAKDARANEFLSQTRKMLINGKWVESASGRTFATCNPADGEELCQVAEGDKEDINRAVKAARKAFEEGPWSKTTPNVRSKMIWKLSELMEKHAQTLAELECLDNGKALTIARAVDVAGSIEQFQYMAGWATKIDGRTMNLSSPGFHAFTRREAVGVV